MAMVTTTAAAPARLSPGTSFWLVAAILVLMPCSSTVPSPLYPVYQQRWHLSATTVTVVFAIYALAVLVSLVGFGSLSGEIGTPAGLGVAAAMLAVSMVLFATAQGVGWLLAA